MQCYKRHFVLMTIGVFLSVAMVVFAANYSTESTGRASRPSRPATTTPSKKARQSPTVYSTEDMAAAPVAKDPNTMTTGTRDRKVYQTKTARRRPAAPDQPRSPKAADCDEYPAVDGGTMVLRPGPYRAGWGSCPNGNRGGFWPGLLGINLSYSWSRDSGGGEFDWGGYRYAWGDNPAYSDYQPASDPNTAENTQADAAVSDANEPPSDASEKPERKVKAAKDR